MPALSVATDGGEDLPTNLVQQALTGEELYYVVLHERQDPSQTLNYKGLKTHHIWEKLKWRPPRGFTE